MFDAPDFRHQTTSQSKASLNLSLFTTELAECLEMKIYSAAISCGLNINTVHGLVKYTAYLDSEMVTCASSSRSAYSYGNVEPGDKPICSNTVRVK